MIRTVEVEEITENIREMCIEANHFLAPDMGRALSRAASGRKKGTVFCAGPDVRPSG